MLLRSPAPTYAQLVLDRVDHRSSAPRTRRFPLLDMAGPSLDRTHPASRRSRCRRRPPRRRPAGSDGTNTPTSGDRRRAHGRDDPTRPHPMFGAEGPSAGTAAVSRQIAVGHPSVGRSGPASRGVVAAHIPQMPHFIRFDEGRRRARGTTPPSSLRRLRPGPLHWLGPLDGPLPPCRLAGNVGSPDAALRRVVAARGESSMEATVAAGCTHGLVLGDTGSTPSPSPHRTPLEAVQMCVASASASPTSRS